MVIRLLVESLEPFAIQCDEQPERIKFHMEWYAIHDEFISPLLLEVGGERCHRKNIDAYLIDGNHRFRAAQALGLETVTVKVVW